MTRGSGYLRRAAILVLVIAPVHGALADGIMRDSAGGISSGRAGTNVAHADDGSVILSNPSAMVNLPSRALLDARLDTYYNIFRYSDPENRAVSEQIPAILPELSYVRKLRGGRLALGFGIVVPGGFAAEYHLTNPVYGERLYRSFAALAKALPAVAYRVTDRLSVGATAGVAVSQVRLKAPYYVQTGSAAGTPTLIDLHSTGVAPAWSLGAQYRLNDATTVGITYVGESSFDLTGRTRVAAGSAAARYDADVDITWPRLAAAGVKRALGHRHRVSADFTWTNWGSAFDEISFDLSDGNGQGLPPKLHDSVALDWNDSWGTRTGYEFFHGRHRLRAGYAFHSSPVPDGKVTPTIPAVLEHFLAVGYGYRFDSWSMDAAFGYSFGSGRNPGTSGFVGGDFDRSHVIAEAYGLWISVVRYFD